jgi:hypothetical protein
VNRGKKKGPGCYRPRPTPSLSSRLGFALPSIEGLLPIGMSVRGGRSSSG